MNKTTLIIGTINAHKNMPAIDIADYNVRTLAMDKILTRDTVCGEWIDMEHMYLRRVPDYQTKLKNIIEEVGENHVYIELVFSNIEESSDNKISIGIAPESAIQFDLTAVNSTVYDTHNNCVSFSSASFATRRGLMVVLPVLRNDTLDESIALNHIEKLVVFIQDHSNI